MSCVEGPPFTELEFVTHCAGRKPGPECRGERVHIGIRPAYITPIAETVLDTPLHDVLWGSPCLQDPSCPEQDPWGFHLCVAHWLDIAYLVGCKGMRGQGTDWLDLSHAMVQAVVVLIGWDRREISNLQRWRELGACANS